MLNICQPHPMGHGPLQWRHNGRDCVSNHQPRDCLLNRLFRGRSKKTSQLHVTGLCAGNSPGTGEFSAQMASNAENASIWWRHHNSWTTPCWCYPQTDKNASPSFVVFLYIWQGSLKWSHPPWTKWPPFRRRYFQVHSCEWKVSYFD